MEFVSIGLYREHLVSYSIKSNDEEHFLATLLRYKGNSRILPPKEIVLLRKGNNWWSDADKELMTFLVNDIAGRLRKEKNCSKEKAKHHQPIAHNSFASAIQEISNRKL